MVVVTVLYDGDKAVEFYTEGHAGYAADNEDICCAGVSAVTQTAVLGLGQHLSRQPLYSLADGWLRCELPAGLSAAEKEVAHVIISTMEAGLRSMQAAYPDNVELIVAQQ